MTTSPGASGAFDPTELIRRLDQRAAELQAQSDRISGALAEAAATVENAHVRITVDPTGAISELVFLDAAAAIAPTALVASVKELYVDAEAAAAERTREAMGRVGLSGMIDAALPAEVSDRLARQEADR